MMYNRFLKRALDFIISLSAFIIFLPFFFIICIVLCIANRGKIFFVQARPGQNERIFKLIKFKTMNDRKDKDNNLLPDSERMTKIGTFIRKSSLDEIPQLINVIKGDMSLIGPRPLLVEYLPLYDSVQKKRHNVRPGITGWSQVNGRNAISWEKKFEQDVWYVEHQSFSLDYIILLKTIKKVVNMEDINSSTSVTMEKFSGNK